MSIKGRKRGRQKDRWKVRQRTITLCVRTPGGGRFEHACSMRSVYPQYFNYGLHAHVRHMQPGQWALLCKHKVYIL